MKRNPALKKYARAMRHKAAPAERVLWSILRDRRLAEFKFRRQHMIGPYIADFYCAQLNLVVELDGESHLGNEARDRNRQEYLESLGTLVLRFWNTEVFEEREAVLERIWQECAKRCVSRQNPSPPTPLPGVPGRGEY